MQSNNFFLSKSGQGTFRCCSFSHGEAFSHRTVASLRRPLWPAFFVLLCPAVCFAADSDSHSVDPAAAIPNDKLNYVLGSHDQIVIRSVHAKEIADKPFRVEANGEVDLPLVGRVQAADLTVKEFELELNQRLKKFYIDPQIAVTIEEFRSQPVSVIGAVGNPGVQQLQGRKCLLEILSLAGGIRPDAGPTVKITRQRKYGVIPLPDAKVSGGDASVAELDLKKLLAARDPAENIIIQPYDVISVPRDEAIFIVGCVKKAGEFAVGGRNSLTVLEALSLAQGLDFRAAAKHARILRNSGSTNAGRVEIPVNLQKILDGKAPDVPLQADDILFVPNSAAKGATARTIEAAVQIGTGFVVFRR
jgi:polysaccharide export outer membrane protein